MCEEKLIGSTPKHLHVQLKKSIVTGWTVSHCALCNFSERAGSQRHTLLLQDTKFSAYNTAVMWWGLSVVSTYITSDRLCIYNSGVALRNCRGRQITQNANFLQNVALIDLIRMHVAKIVLFHFTHILKPPLIGIPHGVQNMFIID